MVSTLPLPLTVAGVSATVNGVPAPLYFVSEGQINLQVPYETSAGAAVLGVNNNGQVASFLFSVSPTAPGVFTDPNHPGALAPYSTGKRGDTLLAFITGEGQQTAFAGVPSGLAGVTQINFIIPANAPSGLQPVVVTVGGAACPPAHVTIMP